jgi:hypothetical protein
MFPGAAAAPPESAAKEEDRSVAREQFPLPINFALSYHYLIIMGEVVIS